MGQEDTSPIQQEEAQQPEPKQEPKQDGSIESAAAKLSGLLTDEGNVKDEPDPEGQPEPEAPKVEEVKEEPKATIAFKIGDKDYSIPADSIPEELRDVVKDGILMRADYTRKTQELSEFRKAADAKAQEVMHAFQATTQLADHIAAVKNVEAQLAQFNNVDWQRIDADDPTGITGVRLRQNFQDLQRARDGLYGQLNSAHQQIQQFQLRQRHEALQAELPKVKEAIPDFGEAKVKSLREGAITHYGKLGLTEGHLDQAATAFELAILNDALQFRALQAKQASVANKVEKLPPKVTRSGTAQTPNTGPQVNQAAQSRLQRSGKVEDAAAVIKSLLG